MSCVLIFIIFFLGGGEEITSHVQNYHSDKLHSANFWKNGYFSTFSIFTFEISEIKSLILINLIKFWNHTDLIWNT